MIELIDNINYLEPNNDVEKAIYEKVNEHYKNEVEKIFKIIRQIKTNHNAKVFAVGNLIDNQINFKLECENVELSEKIKNIFDS
ncbi:MULTISPECIES: hypothetical protein [Winogradskyella]|uniref:hypothetical protein n=1 Tax=Winogradskyella TaxID=286104 RepID=UPI0015C6A455|nr:MULTISPECIES: hypothetical protein [Winogradskyella]QXP78764.1 hypothetical protein H0I32_16405 [Winogradskyella sp. HaHa_3_26]